MNQPKYVLSPCGTSLWTNGASDVERKLLTAYANTAKLEEIPTGDRGLLEARLGVVRDAMLAAKETEAARKSAELNGIIKLYGGTVEVVQDYHLLLCTDTWLGEQAALVVAEWLRQRNVVVEVKRQKELQTKDLSAFQTALSELANWAETTLTAFRESGYRIIFNLTGGFKSVQGFLQSLGMFYADETVYIFETGTDLLRIPRLPVKLATEDSVRANLRIFRRLHLRLPVEDASSIPETLLFEYAGERELSVWGVIAWEQAKRKIYRERVWDSPSESVVFGEAFLESVRTLSADRCFNVNQQLDELARYLESGRDAKYNLRSLDFKDLNGNPMPPSTHELDAWHDQDARRLFGHFDLQASSAFTFIVDRLAKALH